MATFVDLRRMLNNDQRLTSVFLTFSSRLQSEDFRRAVKTNTVVEELVISADESFFQECPEDGIQDILEGLGRLPRLRKVSINSYPNCPGIVSMKAINAMVSGAKQLECLIIADLQVTGSPQDFADFAEHVQGMFFLGSFAFVECKILLEDNSGGTSSSSSSPVPQSMIRKNRPLSSQDDEESPSPLLLDPLLFSLSMLPSLQVVSIQPKQQGSLGSLSVSAATALCLSASIKMLKLRNMDLTPAHAASMAFMLQNNQTLRTLELGCLQGGAMDAATASSLGGMIQRNQALHSLELAIETMLSDTAAEILAKALRHNRRLRSFALTARTPKTIGRVSTKARKSMLQMLQYNYTLEKFFLFRKYPLSREFKLYSKLNQLGRGQLLTNQQNTNSTEAWIQSLANVKDDLNSIFYFVSCNPTLCMSSTELSTKRKTSQSEEEERPSKKQRV
ncbi:expressed unknown protein [Seminavis robusta]|uniref:Uncharacterized protein n=1 Tax=Seminavis robusta TaxID=568900 RepID=A0A9N8H928_9STRA|nr:expressed unknown protein [Seminavis robusta]|eukprot:Sro240_g096190.1 n/a (448) ;mRNA; r:71044-72387